MRSMRSIFFLLLFAACSSSTVEDFQDEGDAIQRSLVKEMHSVHSLEDLKDAVPRLRHRFNKLVDVVIEARQSLPNVEAAPTYSGWSASLRSEMLRIYAWEGARDVMEIAQREALTRLDAFEKDLETRNRLGTL